MSFVSIEFFYNATAGDYCFSKAYNSINARLVGKIGEQLPFVSIFIKCEDPYAAGEEESSVCQVIRNLSHLIYHHQTWSADTLLTKLLEIAHHFTS